MTESGFSVLDDSVTLAAAVRNPGPRAATGITLGVKLKSSTGEIVGELTETVPYCPSGAICWWGGTYGGPEIGKGWRSIDDVDVTLELDDASDARVPRPLGFAVRRSRGAVRGRAPRPQGMVAVVSFTDGEPRAGIVINVKRGMGFGTKIEVPRQILPPSEAEDELRAFMYPMKLPQG